VASDDAKNNLTRKTLDVWRTRATARLSEEDAGRIAENVAGFFAVLLEWEAREREQKGGETCEAYYARSA